MLKAVVEQVRLQAKCLFRKLPGLVSIFANNDGYAELARNQ